MTNESIEHCNDESMVLNTTLPGKDVRQQFNDIDMQILLLVVNEKENTSTTRPILKNIDPTMRKNLKARFQTCWRKNHTTCIKFLQWKKAGEPETYHTDDDPNLKVVVGKYLEWKVAEYLEMYPIHKARHLLCTFAPEDAQVSTNLSVVDWMKEVDEVFIRRSLKERFGHLSQVDLDKLHTDVNHIPQGMVTMRSLCAALLKRGEEEWERTKKDLRMLIRVSVEADEADRVSVEADEAVHTAYAALLLNMSSEMEARQREPGRPQPESIVGPPPAPKRRRRLQSTDTLAGCSPASLNSSSSSSERRSYGRAEKCSDVSAYTGCTRYFQEGRLVDQRTSCRRQTSRVFNDQPMDTLARVPVSPEALAYVGEDMEVSQAAETHSTSSGADPTDEATMISSSSNDSDELVDVRFHNSDLLADIPPGPAATVVTAAPEGPASDDSSTERPIAAECSTRARGFGKQPKTVPSNVERMYKTIQKLPIYLAYSGVIGPIYGELTKSSMQNVVKCMIEHTRLSQDSRFLDVGSGIGKPNLHVAEYPGVSFSCGVECERARWFLGMTCLKAVLDDAERQRNEGSLTDDEAHVHGSTIFLHKNIMDATTFDPFTHVYMFSFGFPPSLCLKLAEMWNLSQSSYLICYHKPMDIIDEYQFNVELVIQMSTSMLGSQEGHTAYIYKRKGNVQQATEESDPLFADAWSLVKNGVVPLHEHVCRIVEDIKNRDRETRSQTFVMH